MDEKLERIIEREIRNYKEIKFRIENKSYTKGWTEILKRKNINNRNKIYELISKDIIIWIKSVLAKWKKNETQSEILSMSWDAFIFCLDQYSDYSIPVPKFFSNCTKYFMLNYYAKKENVFLPLDELKETLSFVHNPETCGFERLLTLQQFREIIPEKYKFVWDDATQSLGSESRKSKQNSLSKEKNMTQATYYGVRDCLIEIIKFIIKI